MRAELDGLPSHGFSPHSLYVDQALSGKVKSAGHSAGASGCSCGRAGGCGKQVPFPAILAGLRKKPYLWRAAAGLSVFGSHPVAPLRRGWAVCGTDRGSGAHIIDFFQHAGGDGSVERIKGVLWDESASLWLSEGGSIRW